MIIVICLKIVYHTPCAYLPRYLFLPLSSYLQIPLPFAPAAYPSRCLSLPLPIAPAAYRSCCLLLPLLITPAAYYTRCLSLLLP